MFKVGDSVSEKKFLIALISILMILIIINIVYFYKLKHPNMPTQTETSIPESTETICYNDCNIGDRIVLSDKSSWHIVDIKENKLVLFSDANIKLDGSYCDLDVTSNENGCQPVSFDKVNVRTTENNPYCIYPDVGCSAYASNGEDVLEDSYIKNVIDTAFLPKIQTILNTMEVNIRLLTKEEFDFLQALEQTKSKSFEWLYYSNYWLMTPYNNYSNYALKEDKTSLDFISSGIVYLAGIRPVMEVDSTYIYNF